MAVPDSLVIELEHAIAYVSAERRAAMLKGMTALFLEHASRLAEDQVHLFDEVLCRLMSGSDAALRAELSQRLAPVANAPAEVVRCLAKDRDGQVARPLLLQSQMLGESELLDIAESHGQAHLLAISRRHGITEPISEVLVRRGDSEVMHSLADNGDACLSEESFLVLLERATKDAALARKLGLRPDFPPRLLGDLARDVGHRVVAAGTSAPAAESHRTPARPRESRPAGPGRDYSAARRTVETLREQNRLDEEAVVAFARTGQFEQTVAALACLCAVPIAVVDRLMAGTRPDPVLVLGKAAGWSWPTVKALLAARPHADRNSHQALYAEYSDFERLSQVTAQRVIRFWQLRSAGK
jgi:uncharacterized protein (DUF2336 family)